MIRVFTQWRPLAGALALAVLVSSVSTRVRGDEDKAAPKRDTAAKKDKDAAPKAAEKPKTAEKPKAPTKPEVPNPLPDVEEMLKRMAPMLDANGLKEMRARMQEHRKQMEKMMRQMQKQGLMPDLAPIPMPMMPMMPMMPEGAWGRMGWQGTTQEPRLGAQVSKPSKTLEDQLDLPKDHGMVLEEVGPNSAAAKAGLKPHDILLELAGKPVSSKREEFAKLLQDVKPDTPVDAVVMRKGKKETIKGLSLPEAKTVARDPRFFPGLPALPPIPNVAPIPMLPGLRGIGGLGGSTSISRINDEFTAKHDDGVAKITVKGKIDQGEAKVIEVQIENAGGQAKTYDSVDKVPADYKEKVKKLTQMSAKGSATFPIR